ncbi:MAG: NAD-dependent epimerase/dehydratase family protein [Desulfobacteraceae bacterium]|jgi:nucleoside-diphosphate-sugar epimerase
MKILIIGAMGKIGSRLLATLSASRAYTIGVFVRTPGKFAENVIVFKGDVLHKKTVHSAIQWADCVVNCSGKVGYSIWDRKELMHSNITGVNNIVNLCERYDKPLVHAGSAASYGLSKYPHAFKEKEICMEKSLKKYPVYFYSKFEAEKIISRSSINSIILRPSSIVLHDGSTLKKLYAIYQKGYVLPFQGGFNFVHMADVIKGFVAAIHRIAQHPTGKEIYNLGGHNISLAELSKYFSTTPTYRIPKFLLLLAAFSDLFLGWLKSPFSLDLYHIMQHYCFVDSSKAVK